MQPRLSTYRRHLPTADKYERKARAYGRTNSKLKSWRTWKQHGLDNQDIVIEPGRAQEVLASRPRFYSAEGLQPPFKCPLCGAVLADQDMCKDHIKYSCSAVYREGATPTGTCDRRCTYAQALRILSMFHDTPTKGRGRSHRYDDHPSPHPPIQEGVSPYRVPRLCYVAYSRHNLPARKGVWSPSLSVLFVRPRGYEINRDEILVGLAQVRVRRRRANLCVPYSVPERRCVSHNSRCCFILYPRYCPAYEEEGGLSGIGGSMLVTLLGEAFDNHVIPVEYYEARDWSIIVNPMTSHPCRLALGFAEDDLDDYVMVGGFPESCPERVGPG